MKNTKTKTRINSQPHKGFTLIELLVVITIIAILAGLVMAQATKMMENGRKLQVQTVIKDLRVAVSSYQTEYNRYPVNASLLSGASSGEDIQALMTDENSGIVDALMSAQSTSGGSSGGGGQTNLNPRDIKFIDLLPAKNGRFGLINTQAPYKLVDLWGQPYRLLFDTNGDKQVKNPDISNADPSIAQSQLSPPPPMLPTDVAIYSSGKDITMQTKDDIVSWSSR